MHRVLLITLKSVKTSCCVGDADVYTFFGQLQSHTCSNLERSGAEFTVRTKLQEMTKFTRLKCNFTAYVYYKPMYATTRYNKIWTFPICALPGIKDTDVIATPAATNLWSQKHHAPSLCTTYFKSYLLLISFSSFISAGGWERGSC